MLFARVECTTIGPDFENLQDNNILRNVDEETIKSLNGCRVTDMILNFIPNKPNFELTLRVIKLWAKHRGVYSNLLGYLGGVNWAIMVARICMDNPEAAPNQLIQKFYTYYRDYDWTNEPLTLCEIQNNPSIVQFVLTEKTLEHLWRPKGNEQMMIITPALPSMNSTNRVSAQTKHTILTELDKAAMITR